MSIQMGNSSDEDTDISESEIDDYIDKPYEQLRTGKYMVRNPNATFRCPFCLGKRKREYSFGELLQHASGVGAVGSSCRSGKLKSSHLALAKYLREDPVNQSSSKLPKTELGKVNEQSKQEQLYVWPWKGIVANISTKQRHEKEIRESAYWLTKFSQYKPVEVKVLWDVEELTWYVILGFCGDMDGYKNVIKLESDFEVSFHGRSDWNARRKDLGSNIYGWCAREDDYNLKGAVGTYLRASTKLDTISNIEKKSTEERNMMLMGLAKELEITNESLNELEYRYNEKNMFLSRMIEENNRLHQAYNEEMEKMQRLSHDNACKIIKETENMKLELDCKKEELDRWCKELSEREALTISERRKIAEETKRRNEQLELASMQQMKANNSVVKLLEKQQREKEAALKKMLDLEKQLNEKHKLQLDIEELRRQQKMLECRGGNDEEAKQMMEEMEEKLNEKIEELENAEYMHQSLEAKAHEHNEQLEPARQVMISALTGQLKSCKTIGIKKIGEINIKPLQNECKKRYPAKRAMELSTSLHSYWQACIQDPGWKPFMDIDTEGMKKKVVVNEEDEKLRSLRSEWGEEASKAVVTALEEMIEYNLEGRCIISELWNYAQNRRATLKEAIAFVVKNIRKRQRS